MSDESTGINNQRIDFRFFKLGILFKFTFKLPYGNGNYINKIDCRLFNETGIRRSEMKEQTNLSADLINAYEATNFHVKAETAFILNIGKVSEDLKALLKQNNVSSAVFITAWNPYSNSLSEDENRFRNDLLKKELSIRSLSYLDGVGQDPAGQWAGEDSFLVLGISFEAAKKLGNQFEQNAIVWADSDAVPKLILLK